MNKRIVILGGGESGSGSAVLAKVKGFDVFLSDFGAIKENYKTLLNKYDIEWEENGHTDEKILNASEIIKSPGISDTVPIMIKILGKEIPVISEIEFAGRYNSAKTICITGSNGKTTTTLLTYHIFKKAGLNVGLAGNIGNSFALQVAENNFDYYVIELSSFQLDGMYNFKADVSILMNITPDHLDRYNNDFSKYTDSKFRIIQNQDETNSFIFFADDNVITNELEKREIKATTMSFGLCSGNNNSAFIENNSIIISTQNLNLTMSIQELALQGKHNAYNSMAASLAASAFKIRKDIIRECLTDFQSVEHRLEPVFKVHGIEFINDSKATNVNSTWYALESYDKPIVWIAGGVDKGNNYSMLHELVRNKVKAIVCLGTNNSKIHKAFSKITKEIYNAGSMHDAVKTAYFIAKQGDTVLLSPACASFDLFENYEDRGRQFKHEVGKL